MEWLLAEDDELLPKVMLREGFMARQAEREVLERGARALVWVGAALSTIRCRGPGAAAGSGRMGFLLACKHPGAITQVYCTPPSAAARQDPPRKTASAGSSSA
ncbi:MAG: hypothetical protein HOP15_03920 [Planctomycetes bacterium]|nr:hypothetical protein [Planctomycetota bacterium]